MTGTTLRALTCALALSVTGTAYAQQADLPAAVAPEHAKMLEQLKGASGAEFTTLYLDTQSQAHKQAVALCRTYAGGGDDAKVKAFANETLPTLEMHADMVQKIVAAQ